MANWLAQRQKNIFLAAIYAFGLCTGSVKVWKLFSSWKTHVSKTLVLVILKNTKTEK